MSVTVYVVDVEHESPRYAGLDAYEAMRIARTATTVRAVMVEVWVDGKQREIWHRIIPFQWTTSTSDAPVPMTFQKTVYYELRREWLAEDLPMKTPDFIRPDPSAHFIELAEQYMMLAAARRDRG